MTKCHQGPCRNAHCRVSHALPTFPGIIFTFEWPRDAALVGDEGEHGEADEDEEGPVAALDGCEAAQAFLRERVGGETGEERDHAGGLT